MSSQINIIVMAFIICFVNSLIILPILRKAKVGQNERDDGPKSHLKKQGTPTMGGIIMIISLIIVAGIFSFKYWNSNLELVRNILICSGCAIGFGVVGFLDDYIKMILKNTKGLSPKLKMLGLLLFACIFTFLAVYVMKIKTTLFIPIIKTEIGLPLWLYIPFTIFVILGTTNAINLTDGVDGLSSSVTTIILTCLTSISIAYGMKEITLIGASLIGICLAFLLFNLHPAKMFMGDTGSLFLGGAVSLMAIYLGVPLLLILIAIIPICETLSVMIQVAHYKRTGNRVFKMAPLHHHFELCGWKENTVVSVFSIITFIACLIGLVII